MRYFSYLVIAGGCFLLLHAAYDQHRGIASVIAPTRSVLPLVVSRSEKPQEFHNLMVYEWIQALLVVALGTIVLGIVRAADKTDPFSTRFAGKAEIEALGRVLDEGEKKQDNQ